MDIASAQAELISLKAKVETYRSRVDQFHDIWFSEAVALAASLKVTLEMPRICGRQTGRHNSEGMKTPSEYFKRAITVPMLGE